MPRLPQFPRRLLKRFPRRRRAGVELPPPREKKLDVVAGAIGGGLGGVNSGLRVGISDP